MNVKDPVNLEVPITIRGLETAFKDARQRALEESDWYRRRKWKHVAASWVIRTVTALLVSLGVILPLVKDAEPFWLLFTFDGPAKAGYACLLVAVIILAMDHVFMFSRSWVRYINAISKIKTLVLATEYKWLKLKTGLADDGAAHENKDEALDIFNGLDSGVRQIVEEETAAWGTELNEALQKLEGLVSEQRTKVEIWANEERKAQKAARDAAIAPAAGGISIDIKETTNLFGVLAVQVGDEIRERPASVQKIVFPNILPGQHAVLLKATDTMKNPVRLEDIVIVKTGEVAPVKFTIPAPKKLPTGT